MPIFTASPERLLGPGLQVIAHRAGLPHLSLCEFTDYAGWTISCAAHSRTITNEQLRNALSYDHYDSLTTTVIELVQDMAATIAQYKDV